MTQRKPKLLYLGYAFSPGVQERFLHINPASHAFETHMLSALREHFEVRSYSLLPAEVPPETGADGSSPGVTHKLVFSDLWSAVRIAARSAAAPAKRLKCARDHRRWRCAP
jgi:hypothetical protein